MRYYSYETYWPEKDGARRASVEDWFESMRGAREAMMTSLAVLPVGSTGICYRRYADGDHAYPSRAYVKDDMGVREVRHA